MSKIHLSFLSFALGIFLASPLSWASEPLMFKAALSSTETKALSKHLEQTDLSHFIIAKADLNRDGLDEFIAKPKNCDKTDNMCSFHVLAINSGQTLDIAKIKAKNLILSNQYTHGVRDLIVYNDPQNDFDYTTFLWDAKNSTYTTKEGLTQ